MLLNSLKYSHPRRFWLEVFFVGCCLSTLSLAASRSSRTLHSLVVTPVGWLGPLTAIHIFYGMLAIVLAALVAASLKPSLLLSAAFWLIAICASLIYLGVGITIGSWYVSVASVSLGTVVYLTASCSLYAAAHALPPPFGTLLPKYISPDAAIFTSLSNLFNASRPPVFADVAGSMLL